MDYITFIPPSVSVLICFVFAAVLLGVSAFASSSEIAFFSLSPTDLANLDADNVADHKILQLREDSERTLATILILNNLVNVTIIMLLNYAFGAMIDFGDAYWLQFLFITVLLTFLLLLFGEIIPKVYSRISPLSFCRKAAGGIMLARAIFWPLENILLSSGIFLDRLSRSKQSPLSVDELEMALEMTDEDDIKEEREMLEGIIRFSDEQVCEIMTSRQDIVGIDMRTTFPDVVRSIVDNNYSRIPVYQDNEDHIRGILYIKDLIPYIGKPANFRWQSLVRPAYFVPETKKVDDMLREFQTQRVHIAIVVDEYGGTCGLVTLEDILEEIVGEISDEYDDEDDKMLCQPLGDDTYVMEGKTKLVDMCRLLSLDDDFFDSVEADTLAGLLLEIKGDFPAIHEHLTFNTISFEIIKKEQRRIARVKVKLQKSI